MTEFSKIKVKDLRAALILYGNEEEQRKATGKKGLVSLATELELSADDIVSINETSSSTDEELDNLSFELEEEEPMVAPYIPDEVSLEQPEYGSSEWNDWIMSMFREDELIDSNPMIGGLRRITESILGEIVASRAMSMHICNWQFDVPPQATVRYEVHIAWKLDPILDDLDKDLPIRIFGGIGGASSVNLRTGYDIYPEAMAETRAEVRALRKALGLTKVAAEELLDSKKNPNVFGDSEVETSISEIQKRLITNKCQIFKVDLNKFINKHFPDKELNDLSRDEGSLLSAKINKYQTNTVESEQIPDDIKLT